MSDELKAAGTLREQIAVIPQHPYDGVPYVLMSDVLALVEADASRPCPECERLKACIARLEAALEAASYLSIVEALLTPDTGSEGR